ncbi:puttive membrane-associated protein with TPR-like domain [Candidatus Ruthia magnifica str. Cm (Calyptogena magnifica)]|uniref:Ancillary SecYEG translocon subunit n=1 Tax=Ruthia magnifica subsp. Calyptogena magnifica TaxID=413404 RepID=A1AWV7_RUTMC|nr:tetratricopeptide repeat protein [Candidatus Ruthturnera calyptogenae]ABL02414.1 puttive membrane-associated protein with TPR-like domain [Candidatus Ruthia magnifica str. Cm (Calyptogena magnifica)]
MKNFIKADKTEEEQIKRWIKENTLQIVVGVALGLGGIFGFDAYKNYQHSQLIKARSIYLTLVSNPNDTQAYEQLKNNHASSGYLDQATLILAKNAVANKNYMQALEYLAPLSDTSNISIAKVVNMRIASLYLEMGHYKQALGALNTVPNSAFDGLYNQLKGDIYLADKQIDNAKKHYKLALNQISKDSKLQNLIKIKLNDLN